MIHEFTINWPELTQDTIARGLRGNAAVSDEAPVMISAVHIANVVLRHRGLIAGMALAVFAFSAVRGLLRERTYTASASFIAEGAKSASPVSGIAAQLGIALPAGAAGQAPAFYVELLKSREILRAVAETKYKYQGRDGATEGDLAAIFEAGGSTPDIRRDESIRMLAEQITASVSARSSVISFTVKAPSASLAAQIVTHTLEEVNRFNLERRQSAVRAERIFAEHRLMEANATLREAENRQKDFLLQNRSYESSPTLTVEFQRLQREVVSRQGIASFVGQAYEQSKIEEVRDTPIITVLEAPTAPSRPDPRGAFAGALIGLLVGTTLGLALAFAREWSTRAREDAMDEFVHFDVLRQRALDDLRHPWRTVARIRRLGSSTE